MIFPPAELRCTYCGAVFPGLVVARQERFWRKNPRGPFFFGSDPYGPSYDRICPTCGAENPFEPFDPENDPLPASQPAGGVGHQRKEINP